MYMAYNMLGHINRYCGNKESAKRNFRTVIDMMEKGGYYESMPPIYMNLVNVELDDDPEEASRLLDKAKEIEVSLDDTKVKNVSGRILTSKNVADYNDFEHPDKVQPAEFKGAKVKKGKLTVKVPAKSIIVLNIK
jgi:alpha-L-arabinofuranosidase